MCFKVLEGHKQIFRERKNMRFLTASAIFNNQSPVPKFDRAKYVNHPCMEVAIADPLLF